MWRCLAHSQRPRQTSEAHFSLPTPGQLPVRCSAVSLYKILFHFKALLWESIILLLPPPHNLQRPSPLQYYCMLFAQYTPPNRPPLCMPYTIHYW